MDIESIVKLISDYGVSVVINGVFIIAIFAIFKYMSNQNEKMLNRILEDKGKYNKDFKEKFEERLSKATKIQTIIDNLRADLDADYVLLAQYHNGGMNLNDLPFVRFSVTNEAVKTGLISYIRNYKDLPVSLLVHWKDIILDPKKDLFIDDIKEIEKYASAMYHTIKDTNAKSLAAYGIYTIDDKPLAFLAILCSDKHPKLTESEKRLVEIAKSKITILLQ